jgi:prolyl-tRNA synthetase
VEADTGAIGGTLSHEFQVLADSGEDALVSCNSCDYAANVQKAEVKAQRLSGRNLKEVSPPLRKVATPGKKSVAEVAGFLSLPPDRFIKTLVYRADQDEMVAVLVRGDHEVNELKVMSLLGSKELAMADENEVEKTTGTSRGFLGPIGLRLRIVADQAIQGMRGAVTGANEADAHFMEVDQERDFTPSVFADLRMAGGGDPCPRCDHGSLESHRGIEVGQIFYLGTKYSECMGATYLDAEGRERPVEMGCYGIGITRLLAAAIEQNHDADGIIWPLTIAPFHVLVLPINYTEKAVQDVTDGLCGELLQRGIELLLDDRDERPGVKFKDADLIGVPLRVTVGNKGLARGCVEVRWRAHGGTEDVPVEQAGQKIESLVTEALKV